MLAGLGPGYIVNQNGIKQLQGISACSAVGAGTVIVYKQGQ